jgi:hypothetical protein
MENTIGETAEKKAFVGQHDSPVRVGADKTQDIRETPLESKDTAGKVGKPVFADHTLNATGTYKTNTDTNLNITASEENRSAQFKNPRVKQSVEPVQVQYNDPGSHS